MRLLALAKKAPDRSGALDCRWRTSGQRPLTVFSLLLLEKIATILRLNGGKPKARRAGIIPKRGARAASAPLRGGVIAKGETGFQVDPGNLLRNGKNHGETVEVL
jgi:hypothetical protein